MEENKELPIHQEDEQNPIAPDAEAEAPECAQEAPQPESEEPTAYRGIGTGRRESPFADAPYVVNHQTHSEEPYRPRYQAPDLDEAPVHRDVKRKKSGIGRKILACVAVLALVFGSCFFTAHRVNAKWEDRVDAMEASFSSQLTQLQQQVQTLTPESTGNSVSGTVAVGNGMTAAQVYAQNVRAVVLIEAAVTTELFGQSASGVTNGSGFILTENGYVVTNFHVVEGATAVNVILYDGTSCPAALVGYDSTNDLAVLKIEAEGLQAVTLGSSNNLIVGDQVVAIGNPLGELTATLTVGYVSAKERTINTDGTIINMIQTDAAINSGNSGGPLFNMKGEVVGITTAKYSGQSSSGATIEGIGFAIPVDDVAEAIGELIEFGYIKSAFLGVLVQNMDASVASVYGLPVGAYVAGVEEGYCAQRAGIQAKDIIIAVGDVTIEGMSDLTRALREYEPGDTARITVYRAGQILEFSVVLDERPASAG